MEPVARRTVVREHGRDRRLEVVRFGVGPLRTPFGRFHQVAFSINDRWDGYYALVAAPLNGELQPVFSSGELLVRVDSGCVTGQTYGDQTCDCKQQLDRALAEVGGEGEGVVIQIPRQDGRGLGLAFKLATLMLQEELGVDTVRASALLDPDNKSRDERDYGGVIAILRFFGLADNARIRLLSNNPEKLTIFHENGYKHARLRPIAIPPTEHTRQHLMAKKEQVRLFRWLLGRLLDRVAKGDCLSSDRGGLLDRHDRGHRETQPRRPGRSRARQRRGTVGLDDRDAATTVRKAVKALELGTGRRLPACEDREGPPRPLLSSSLVSTKSQVTWKSITAILSSGWGTTLPPRTRDLMPSPRASVLAGKRDTHADPAAVPLRSVLVDVRLSETLARGDPPIA